jgi:hypothetical protein
MYQPHYEDITQTKDLSPEGIDSHLDNSRDLALIRHRFQNLLDSHHRL